MAAVVASFNVENLFSRPRAFDTADWPVGEPILSAYREFNALIGQLVYSPADRVRMRQLLIELDVYHVNDRGAGPPKGDDRSAVGVAAEEPGAASTASRSTRQAA
jgi:hypothetical protein